MNETEIPRTPKTDPLAVTNIDLRGVRQLRPFKIDYREVQNLQYVDHEGRKPQTFADFSRLHRAVAMEVEEQARPAFPADLRYLGEYSRTKFPKGKVLVLVNAGLYESVKGSIAQYVTDLAYEGYYATAYKVNGGQPTELRNFIIGKRPVVGALLVGSLPTAWFEMADDFYGTSEFPCDLYYMDLDGTWKDPDHDGKFSEHPTGVAPEIWVGRLWTPTANGNDADLVNSYFRRNHLYRKGLFGASDRALAYVDDDWQGFGDCALDSMFPASHIEVVTDPAATDGDRFKAEINQHRAWAHICAHSSPGGHSFKIPAGGEWVPATYLRDVNPPNAYFYNLFACSNTLFTQPDYMGGWYIFDKPGGSTCNGLAAVGSTKTGSMLLFENFYGAMATGRTVGQAMVEWWRALGADHDLGERRWYYGLALLGDPTLNWWTGMVPRLRDPFDGDTFDHFPRLTHFLWDTVPVSGATYNIEIDAHGARVDGQWAAESGLTWLVSGNLATNSYEHMFVGAQRGRWRVRARMAGMVGPWSDWRYFRYTT
ncbi:MAG TPA: C25 family cysteine peptidase [Micromonosporaceae bacterium]|nr:C25 family cysteine peptidase [Micromonosporaceae bacterium]